MLSVLPPRGISMRERSSIRVAAIQLASGDNLAANLRGCLRMIDKAALLRPGLIVLPEFCNHVSWYEDRAHCFRVSVTLNSGFLRAIAAKARDHATHIVINCTVQRDDGVATGTSLLYGPDGELLAASDKQLLMGHQNNFLQRAKAPGPVTTTEIGRLGLYTGTDGLVCETPRSLALRGAQILCNSLSSAARCQNNLHIPARATENRVFVVAANKVGPLVPKALLAAVSQTTGTPEHYLHGAGASQIVAPDGTVLARANASDEQVIWADIDPRQADDKRRLDSTDLFRSRRPDLYAPLVQATARTAPYPCAPEVLAATATLAGGAWLPTVDEALREAAAAGVTLLVLPELAVVGTSVTNVTAAAQRCDAALEYLLRATKELDTDLGVVTTIVRDTVKGIRHTAVLVSGGKLVGYQDQLHPCARHPWATPDNRVKTIDLPWARVALIVGDDALYPESFRLAALAGAQVAAVSFHAQEAWELQTGLLERAAENRLCLVAATRPTPVGNSIITTLHKDFTLMTPWTERSFDGELSSPLVRRSGRYGLLMAPIHPINANNKLLASATDLVQGRPWALSGVLASPHDTAS